MNGISGTYVVRKYWKAIFAIAVLATVVAYAASYLVSPSFSSTAHVLLRIRDVRYTSGTGQDQSRQQATVMDSALVKTLAETTSNLISSQVVAEQVVQDLHLDQPKPQDSSFMGRVRSTLKQAYKVGLAYVRYGYYAEPPAHQGAVEAVQAAVTATQLKDSYTIEVKALADDPDLAAAMANSAAKAAISAGDERTKQESEQFRNDLKTSVDQALSSVTAADDAIRQYSESNGVTDLAEQLRLSADDRSTAQHALSDLNAQLQDDYARRDSLNQTIANTDATIDSTTTVSTRSSTSSPQTTTGTITVQGDPQTSTTATGRASTTTTNEPGTTTTRNNLTTTQNTDSNTSENHSTTNPNPLYQGLQGSLLQLQTEIAGLEARRGQLEATIDETNKSANSLPDTNATLSGLQLQANTARSTYTSLRSTYDASVADAASLTPDVTLIDTAVPPVYPDKPWRWLFALIGLLLGGLFGLAVGYGVEALGPSGTNSADEPAPRGPARVHTPAPVYASQRMAEPPAASPMSNLATGETPGSRHTYRAGLQQFGVAVEVEE